MFNMGILNFINSIRNTDKYIEIIYLKGGCYKFHLLLNKFFNTCKPYINENKNHVITQYKGKFYDITGEIIDAVYKKNYTLMTKKDKNIAEEWNFYKNNVLSFGECKVCGEPITL